MFCITSQLWQLRGHHSVLNSIDYLVSISDISAKTAVVTIIIEVVVINLAHAGTKAYFFLAQGLVHGVD